MSSERGPSGGLSRPQKPPGAPGPFPSAAIRPATRGARARYFPLLLAASLGVVAAALASFSHAVTLTLGPLEGLPLDASGALAPEAPVRVALYSPASIGPMDGTALTVRTASALAPEPADILAEERAEWVRALPSPTWSVTLLPALPETGAPYEVLIIPAGTPLEPGDLTRLGSWMDGGGTVLAGLPGLWPGPASTASRADVKTGQATGGSIPDAALDCEWLSRWWAPRFGVTLLNPIDLGAHFESTLTPIAPPRRMDAHIAPALLSDLMPFRATRPSESLRCVGVAGAPMLSWRSGDGGVITGVDPARPPAELAAATALSTPRWRNTWLGVPLRQVAHAARDRASILEAVTRLTRWTANRPLLRADRWAGGSPAPGLVIPVSQDARKTEVIQLANKLDSIHIPSTWLFEREPEHDVRARLTAFTTPHDIGILGPSWLGSRGPVMARQTLLDDLLRPSLRDQLEHLFFQQGEESAPDVLYSALETTGVRYLIPVSPQAPQGLKSRPSLPSDLRPVWPLPVPGQSRLVQLPLPFDPTRAEEGDSSSATPLSRWRHYVANLPGDGWPLMQISPRAWQEDPAAVERLLTAVARPPAAIPTPELMSKTLARWESARAVSIEIHPLRQARLHLRITGAQQPSRGIRASLFLPRGAVGLGVESHHVLADEAVLSRPVAERVTLEFARLAPRRTQDFFLSMAGGAASEPMARARPRVTGGR